MLLKSITGRVTPKYNLTTTQQHDLIFRLGGPSGIQKIKEGKRLFVEKKIHSNVVFHEKAYTESYAQVTLGDIEMVINLLGGEQKMYQLLADGLHLHDRHVSDYLWNTSIKTRSSITSFTDILTILQSSNEKYVYANEYDFSNPHHFVITNETRKVYVSFVSAFMLGMNDKKEYSYQHIRERALEFGFHELTPELAFYLRLQYEQKFATDDIHVGTKFSVVPGRGLYTIFTLKQKNAQKELIITPVSDGGVANANTRQWSNGDMFVFEKPGVHI